MWIWRFVKSWELIGCQWIGSCESQQWVSAFEVEGVGVINKNRCLRGRKKFRLASPAFWMWSSSVSYKHSMSFPFWRVQSGKVMITSLKKTEKNRIGNIYLPWSKMVQLFSKYEFLKLIALFIRLILWIVEAEANLNKWAYIYLIGLFLSSNE